MRGYTIIDLIRFRDLANDNKELRNIDLIKLYNQKYPEVTEKEKMDNLLKVLGITGNTFKLI